MKASFFMVVSLMFFLGEEMRIAILRRDHCKPRDCNFLCMRMCPINRTGKECITVDEEARKPVISESLCTGCGICVKKCPYEAIHIINLPEELEDPVHQYGVNGFRLYNLPLPKEGVVGVVGSNGIGKSTALKMLSGELKPNLGVVDEEVDWSQIIERFKGREIQGYFEKLSRNEVKAVYKPQYVESIPRVFEGTARELLEKASDSSRLDELVAKFNLHNALDKRLSELSGGELQKTAVTACLAKDADVYLLDEPSSYLDVSERLNVARTIRGMKDKTVFVVEHDLVVLDYLSDHIHVVFGVRGAYGIVSNVTGTRVGINEYLGGFLKSENMRFREEIRFDVKAPKAKKKLTKLLSYSEFKKTYPKFSLTVDSGSLYNSQILGILGPNATGKTTFVKVLASVEKPDDGELGVDATVSYKPQYVKPSDNTVASLGLDLALVSKFRLQHLLDRKLSELSGGELQKTAIADCLSKPADIYLLDEPSAYLDVEERLGLGKYLSDFISSRKESTILVVDHDILLVDSLSDELIVFEGESGVSGHASKPTGLRKGMNQFLQGMDVSFRRDPESGRPRANKPESVKDREQKTRGEYYYVG